MGNSNPVDAVSTRSQQIASLAKKYTKLHTLHHHIDTIWLTEAFRRTRKDGAVGVDGVSAATYAADLPQNLADLEGRLKSGSYFAPPGKRAWVPKGKHAQRPISICCFEDKVAQRAVAMVMEPIFEQEFLDCSHGFRRNRSPHNALNELFRQIRAMNGCWLLDADIKSYFDDVNKQHLRSFVRTRIRDGVINRLLGKWLKAGVMDDGLVHFPDTGVPQGGVLSPLLSNIYLHEVLDKWFTQEVLPRLSGRAFLLRFADDFVIGFAREEDARRVLSVLPKRFGRYGLTLHPEKTRLLHFVPPTDGHERTSFDFLGFTHYWGRSRKGNWIVKQTTRKSSMRKGLAKVWDYCRSSRHERLSDQCDMLNAMLRGHYQFFGITGNYRQLLRFFRRVRWSWRYWLNRRSHGQPMTWSKYLHVLDRFPLERPRVVHSVYASSQR